MFSHHQRILLCFLCLTVAMSQYNYSHYMSIPISGTISTFAISDDEEYIIAGDTAGSMLFLKNNGSGWSVTQNFTNAANASQYVDISSNHEWAVFGSLDGNVYVFKYYDSNSSFDLHQTLNPNSSTTIKDVDLTDDYQSLIFTNSDYTFLYEFNGADYDLVEQFTLPAFQVRMCDDKSFFVLSYYETLAIYEKNGNTYTYSYDIFDNYVATQTFQIDLSGDCNYLISFFGMLSSYIYKYDGSNWTVIEQVQASYSSPSISDYGEIAVSLDMYSDGRIFGLFTNNSGYQLLGTLQNSTFTSYCTIGGNYAITTYPSFGINIFELTGLMNPGDTDPTEPEAEVTEGNWIIIGSVVGGVIVLSALITGAIVYFKPAPQITPVEDIAEAPKKRESINVEEIKQTNHETSASVFKKTPEINI